MSKITFYRQRRQDGGTRTAITVNDETPFHAFEPGTIEPSDPALEWFIDVRCEGKRLPTEADAAKRWLLDQGGTIRRGLQQFADRLAAGLDEEIWPLQHPVTPAPRGVKIAVVCSAIRRVERLRIAEYLRELEASWEDILRSLPALPLTSSA